MVEEEEATFGRFLIHRRSPLWADPHVWLGRVFMPDTLPDASPKGCVSPPRIELGIFCLLSEHVNPDTFLVFKELQSYLILQL